MIIELAPASIKPSPTNPRKRGLHDGLEDLVESIRAKGLLQPVVVRAKGKGHELVFGHRRREAAIKAELATIPCIVREFSDDEVLEVQIVENLEREDVHPLDEAEGFAELVRRGRTVQQIAEKVGRPASFVAQRMKLLELTKDAREALDNQQITLAVAMVIARVPAKLQDEALDRVIGERDWQTGEPCSAARALEIVKKDFVLRLTLAKFQTDDALLVKAAGACTACPKRSGNQGVLFADFEAEDLCLDPACYRSKQDAAFARIQKDKPERYAAAIAGKAAKEALSSTVYSNGKFVRLDATVSFPWNNYRQQSVAKILGKKDLPPITLAQDPESGELVELVGRADVEKVARAKAKTTPKQEAQQVEKSASRKAEDMKKKAFSRAVRSAVGTIIERAPAKLSPELTLRLIVLGLARKTWNEDQKAVLERRGLMPEKEEGSRHNAYQQWGVQEALLEHAQNIPGPELGALGLELVANIHAPRANWSYDEELEEGELDVWGQLLDAAGVDFKALEKVELDALKAKEKEKADKAKARAQKEAAKAKSTPAPATTAKKKPAKKARKAAA